MAHGLVIALLVSVFSVDYLVHERQLLSSYFILVPELLSALAMLVVFGRFVTGARVHFDWRYGAFIVVLLTTITLGYALQDVPTGPMVAGVRNYLKFLPFLLLPAVYPFTAAQLRKQIIVFYALLAIQTPLAIYQRFVEFADRMGTGDPVRGTAATSSALSMLLLCGIAGIVTLYLRDKLKPSRAFLLIAWLFIPTTLNETKATILLLPITLILPALAMPRGMKAGRKLLPIIGMGAIAAVGYVIVYNALLQYRERGASIGDFAAKRGFVEQYLYTGAADHDVKYLGRFDSIQLAFEHIVDDPTKLVFGWGAGNVSTSSLTQFEGEFVAYYDRFGVGMTELTTLLWETGLMGVAMYMLLHWFLFSDAYRLARSEDPFSGLGQAWLAVVTIMTFALIYKATFPMNEISYPFWYFGGVVLSRSLALAQTRVRTPHAVRATGWRASTDGQASGALLGAQD
jgi:hypothetical protein